ncbi:MAG: hypothetical protein Q9163_002648 [Psora crenata]
MNIRSLLKLCFTVLLTAIFLAPRGGTALVDRRNSNSIWATKHLEKRADIIALYNNAVAARNFVGLGRTEHWHLDPSNAALFTTAEFYGCTVVIVVNGRHVVIGHYAQEARHCFTMENRGVVEQDIIPNLQRLGLDHLDILPDTRAWIITTASINSVGYKIIMDTLLNEIEEADNIKHYQYSGSSGVGSFPNAPKGKAVVQWTPKTDASGGATLNVYIENDQPRFTQDYDCDGAPIAHGSRKRDGTVCHQANSTPSSITAEPAAAPSCTYMGPEPPIKPAAFCSCGSISLPLKTVAGTPLPKSSSCAYLTLPTLTTSAPMDSRNIITDMPGCQICTRYAENEADCSSITDCLPQAPQATVQVGSSPVHVGTLTSTALYTSISSALEKLCPSVTQTTEMTHCETGSVKIPNIPFVDAGVLNNGGELVVKVESSAYNVTSLRDAMIKSAAMTANNSTQGRNCFTASYSVEQWGKRSSLSILTDLPRRWLGLAARDHPHPVEEQATWCNAASFAGVNYYGPYARWQETLASTDYLDASWDFEVKGGEFSCEFLEGLIDALAFVQPEFTVADLELSQAIGAICMDTLGHS